MGRYARTLLTMLALSMAAPAAAQVVVAAPPPPSATRATHEHVMSRLLSFDLNDDGRIAGAELPERMHHLLTQGDINGDLGLDSYELRLLTASPQPQRVLRQFVAGRYGFGDGFGLDSRLHIEGAIEDLRLADESRDRALAIARDFEAGRKGRIMTGLMNTMAQILTPVSLEDFKGVVERSEQSVRMIENHQTVASANQFQQMVMRMRTGSFDHALVPAIDKYGLPPDQQELARAAIRQYGEQKNGLLGDVERQALLDELNPVLDEQQRDDLRAALERRPLVKQGGVFFIDRARNVVVSGQQAQPQAEALVHRLVIAR